MKSSLVVLTLYLTLGKTNMGGMAFPAAFTAHTTVTSSALSADVIEPTCFFSFLCHNLNQIESVESMACASVGYYSSKGTLHLVSVHSFFPVHRFTTLLKALVSAFCQ